MSSCRRRESRSEGGFRISNFEFRICRREEEAGLIVVGLPAVEQIRNAASRPLSWNSQFSILHYRRGVAVGLIEVWWPRFVVTCRAC